MSRSILACAHAIALIVEKALVGHKVSKLTNSFIMAPNFSPALSVEKALLVDTISPGITRKCTPEKVKTLMNLWMSL